MSLLIPSLPKRRLDRVHPPEVRTHEAPVAVPLPPPVWLWGVPFAPLTFRESIDQLECLILGGKPSYVITLNLHTMMLVHQNEAFRKVVVASAFNVADGMPLIWATRYRPRPLPERVAGSDLAPELCKLAAARGYRVYFLGAGPGTADAAARRLRAQYPGLKIVGTESPPFRPMTSEENAAFVNLIRAARPDILFASFSQPRGDFWVRDNYQAIGAPLCLQIGATLDFLAGRVPRAPRWMQKFGLEWAYRLYREPRRLLFRYTENMAFLMRRVGRDLAAWAVRQQRRSRLACRGGRPYHSPRDLEATQPELIPETNGTKPC
jgi:N-acetylglucosaminyldiphosphoundecaprenol N-acetyl-beta-D-mannosaminyltransferase